MPRRGICAAAIALLVGACATAVASASTASGPLSKTLTVKITSGPEGTVTTPTVSFSFVAEGTAEPGTIFHCGETPLTLSECASPHTEGPLAPGLHTFYVFATNKAANAYSALASCTFTVATAAGAKGLGSGCHDGAPGPSLGPVVTSFAQSAARWRGGSALARISRAAGLPRGTTFSFAVNQLAVAHLTFTQALSGRSVAGRCVAQTSKNHTKRSCRRIKSAGTLTLTAPAGADRLRFEGRLSSARRLKPGRYTVALSATAAGVTSTLRSLSFTIVS
jgi:hypothetical protein